MKTSVAPVTWLVLCLLLAGVLDARADLAHQPVFYEGRVGPYSARIGVRPPGVIPGLAEISVRILEGDVRQVTALPLKWNSGRQGAPPPDVATPVRGETNLFAAQLWFMEGGALSVEVALDGAAGEGRVFVPVNSVATRMLNVPRGLGTVLAVLGAVLAALLLAIIGAAIRESVLPPGAHPSRRRVWAARISIGVAAILLTSLLWGGSRWWNHEAANYRNNRLYRPRPLITTLANTAGSSTLRLELEESDPRQTAPLVPDHGRLMHVFLVREPAMDALAHLHPVRVNRSWFETPLPPLPPGDYSVYAQVTQETGFSQTLTNRIHLDGSDDPAGAPSAARGDDEDSWWAGTPAKTTVSLEGGFTMTFLPARSPALSQPESLPFEVRDAEGRPAILEPFLGMMGHLVVRSASGRVFAHVHPAGSFSMAAQQLFELRDAGKAPTEVVYGANDPACQLPSLEESTEAWRAQKPMETPGHVSFPYEFIEPDDYRLWVQVKVGGRILTGAFKVDLTNHDEP